MTLTQDTVSLALAPRPVRYFDSVGSTNDVALDWLRDHAPPGAVVVASEQTHGRGRAGRAWQTPHGGALAVSIVDRPATFDVLHRRNMAATLAVVNTLRAAGVTDVGVKWPNDVQVGAKKVSGVLVEAVWHGDDLAGAVVGIGINIAATLTGDDVRARAASVNDFAPNPVDPLALLSVMLFQWDQLVTMPPDVLFTAWRDAQVLLGSPIVLHTRDGETPVRALDVTQTGELVVEHADGAQFAVTAGDVSVRRHSA